VTRAPGFFAPAKTDIAEARNWYRREAPEQIPRFRQSLKEATDLTAAMPLAFADQGGGLRSVGLKVFPYRIWYVVEDPGVVIILVIHTSRDPALVDQRLQD
jgi:plasmid stabilization system protein ParE